MKSTLLCSALVFSVCVFSVQSSFAASSQMSTTTSGNTSTTTMPGGVSSVCEFNAGGGLMDADLNIPNSVVSDAMGEVSSLLGASVAMNQVNKRLKKIINRKAAEFCKRVARLNSNEGGEASSAETENEAIYTDYSAYTDQIQLIDTQIEALASTITPTNAETVLAEINALTEQQNTVMVSMEADMDNDATDYTESRRNVAGSDPAADDSGYAEDAEDELEFCDTVYTPPTSEPAPIDYATATEEEIEDYEAAQATYEAELSQFIGDVESERQSASTGKFDEDGNPINSSGGCSVLASGNVCCSSE